MPLVFAENHQEMATHLASSHDARAGGTVSFIGTVRRENHGKEVSHLEYEAHAPLAQELFRELETTAQKRFGIISSHACHRLLRVEVGEPAVVIHARAPHRHEAFLATRFLIDELKRALPIWKKEIYTDGTASFGHGLCLHALDDKARDKVFAPPARALSSMGVSSNDLANRRVVLIGAGGLGVPLAINLCAFNVKLTIIDGDRVSLSNLARQYAYCAHDEGKSKAELLQRFVDERAGFGTTVAYNRFVDEAYIKEIIPHADLIVDATDDRATKKMLKRLAHQHRIALVSASVHQQDGEVQTYVPGISGCLLCFEREDFVDGLSCAQLGALTHVCQLVAAIATDRALMLLTGTHAERHELTIVDPRRGLQRLAIAKDESCMNCGSVTLDKRRLITLARPTR